jgi:hypothetical protein
VLPGVTVDEPGAGWEAEDAGLVEAAPPITDLSGAFLQAAERSIASPTQSIVRRGEIVLIMIGYLEERTWIGPPKK